MATGRAGFQNFAKIPHGSEDFILELAAPVPCSGWQTQGGPREDLEILWCLSFLLMPKLPGDRGKCEQISWLKTMLFSPSDFLGFSNSTSLIPEGLFFLFFFFFGWFCRYIGNWHLLSQRTCRQYCNEQSSPTKGKILQLKLPHVPMEKLHSSALGPRVRN